MGLLSGNEFPSSKVKAYTLEEGNILRIMNGKSSALSLRTSDGCVRVGRTSVIRINKSTKKYHFNTWEEMQAAMDKPRVSTKAGDNETIVIVRKGDPFPVEPDEGDDMSVKEGHERIVEWAYLGYSAALQRVQNTSSSLMTKWLLIGSIAITIFAMFVIGTMAVVYFTTGSGGGSEITPTPTAAPFIGEPQIIPRADPDLSGVR